MWLLPDAPRETGSRILTDIGENRSEWAPGLQVGDLGTDLCVSDMIDLFWLAYRVRAIGTAMSC